MPTWLDDNAIEGELSNDEYSYIDLTTGKITPIPKVSDLPNAKMFFCFVTKSGDFVRLPYTGSQEFLLSKEFLDVVKTEHIPVPGSPGLTTQHKQIWVEVEYEPGKVKEENIVRFDPNDPEGSWKAVKEMARKTGWIP